MNSVETDTAEPKGVDPPSEQTPALAAALTRFSPPVLLGDQWNEGWIMTQSILLPSPARVRLDRDPADSGAAKHV